MIGANIRRLRIKHGMTQKNLADKLFVSAQAVSRWENDEVEPSIGTILELSKIFGTTVDEILNPDEAPADKTENNPAIEDVKTEESESEEIPSGKEEYREAPRQVLALCCRCNQPIYDSKDIVRKEDNKIYCQPCISKMEEQKRSDEEKSAKIHRILSFIFGPLAAIAFFLCTINARSWNFYPFNDPSINITAIRIILTIGIFTFVSCCILNNNFVGYIFIGIASWSVKFPGLICTWDIDGCLWLIAMKILFAVISFLIGVFMLLLGFTVGVAISVFVYPYAIIMNFNHPENTFF